MTNDLALDAPKRVNDMRELLDMRGYKHLEDSFIGPCGGPWALDAWVIVISHYLAAANRKYKAIRSCCSDHVDADDPEDNSAHAWEKRLTKVLDKSIHVNGRVSVYRSNTFDIMEQMAKHGVYDEAYISNRKHVMERDDRKEHLKEMLGDSAETDYLVQQVCFGNRAVTCVDCGREIWVEFVETLSGSLYIDWVNFDHGGFWQRQGPGHPQYERLTLGLCWDCTFDRSEKRYAGLNAEEDHNDAVLV